MTSCTINVHYPYITIAIDIATVYKDQWLFSKKYLLLKIAGLRYTRAYVTHKIVWLSHGHMCNYRAI